MLEPAPTRPHRHPRVGGDPLVLKVFKVKMDSRFYRNDGQETGMKGQGVFNE